MDQTAAAEMAAAQSFVLSQYRVVLGREPEAEGFDYWVGRVMAGATQEEIRNAFIGSAEFAERETFVSLSDGALAYRGQIVDGVAGFAGQQFVITDVEMDQIQWARIDEPSVIELTEPGLFPGAEWEFGG